MQIKGPPGTAQRVHPIFGCHGGLDLLPLRSPRLHALRLVLDRGEGVAIYGL